MNKNFNQIPSNNHVGMPNQNIPIENAPAQKPIFTQQKRNSCSSCFSLLSCLIVILLLIGLGAGILIFFPGNITLLILGIDNAPHKSFIGRSDTIIMANFDPIKPYAGILSVPRDLWVNIPGIGENRINTAHFFAEANLAGSGPQATIDTIEANTGIKMKYYVRIRFEGLIEIVDAMSGVDINLSEPMAGYQPGQYHLNGTKALAFARNRSGSDDFFRMKQGQLLIKSMINQLMLPKNLIRLPRISGAILNNLETNLPIWQMPRIIITILLVGFNDIDSRVIDREMVTPYTTNQGANILLPRWENIIPVMNNMFGQ